MVVLLKLGYNKIRSAMENCCQTAFPNYTFYKLKLEDKDLILNLSKKRIQIQFAILLLRLA